MACSLKAQNGATSKLAIQLNKEIKDENQLRNVYYKTRLPQFKKWYGEAKLDKNSEPVLQTMKGGVLYFQNDDGEKLTIEELNEIYPDASDINVSPKAQTSTRLQRLKEEFPEYYEANKEQLELEDAMVIDVKKRLIKKKNRYKNSKYGAKKTKEIKQLLSQLDLLNTKTAIFDYFNFALAESNRMLAKAESIIKEGGTLKDMDFVVDYISAFDNIISIYNLVEDQKMPGSELVFDKQFFKQMVQPVLGNIALAKEHYRNFALKEVSEKLVQYNRDAQLTKQDIQQMLLRATQDVNAMHYWLDSMAESDDQVLALIDRAVKESRNKINQKMQAFKNGELRTRLKELEDFQKTQGISTTNYEQMYGFMLQTEQGTDGQDRLTGEYKPSEQVLEEIGDENDPRYKFAKMYEENYLFSLGKLPNNYKVKATSLPTILKSDAERATEQGLGKTIKEGIKDSFSVRADETSYGDLQVYTDENGNVIKHVPVHYVMQVGWNSDDADFAVQPDELSLNLASNLLQFMTMSENYAEMTELVPYFEASKKLLAERRVDVKQGGVKGMIDKALAKEGQRETVTRSGIETNSYKMLVEYLDAHVYGEFRLDAGTFELGGAVIDKNKLADALIKYTSVNSLGLNLFSGAANVTMGTLMNGIEASSGMFFDRKSFRSAMKEYGKSLQGFMKDATQRFTTSKLGLFMESFDLFQEFNEYGEKIEHKNGLLRNGNKALYWMQNSGEHFIQTTHAIAMAKSHKIHEGKALSYFEWLEATGKPKSKETKKEFNDLKSVFDAIVVEDKEIVREEDDSTYMAKEVRIEGISQEEALAFSERVKGNYQHNHGNYARQDAPNINRRWWGKMLMLFRKWLKPGINRRFSKEYFDQRLGAKYAGNYTVTYKFMQSLIKDIRQVGMGFVLYWNTPQYQQLSEWEKSQITKTMREIMLLGATAVLAMFLHGLQEDEEEKVWALSFAEFLANRVYQETFTYTNPKEFLKTLRSPTATVSTLEKVVTTLQSLMFWERYKSGEHKDELKFLYQARDLFPVASQFDKIVNIDEILKFQNK